MLNIFNMMHGQTDIFKETVLGEKLYFDTIKVDSWLNWRGKSQKDKFLVLYADTSQGYPIDSPLARLNSKSYDELMTFMEGNKRGYIRKIYKNGRTEITKKIIYNKRKLPNLPQHFNLDDWVAKGLARQIK